MIDRSDDERRRDGRLAWSIVLGCALLAVALLVTLLLALRDPVARWMEPFLREDMERAHRQARLDASGSAYELPPRPAPPVDTAKPIGDVAGWFGPDDYPSAAQRAGEEGRVRVTVASDLNGLPTGCSVAVSSGYMLLDNGTCTIMLQKARFDRAPAGRTGVRFWTSPPIR